MKFGRIAMAAALCAAMVGGSAWAGGDEMAEGMIRKVSKDSGKLTIKHGPLKTLGMPPMTMVFRVADPVMLDAVKAGDKVRFVAEDVDGALTVMKIEGAK